MLRVTLLDRWTARMRADAVLLALVTAAAVAIILLTGCGDECLVTGTGSKLCGSDAAAWCRSTWNVRDYAAAYGDQTSRDTQRLCKHMIRTYGG